MLPNSNRTSVFEHSGWDPKRGEWSRNQKNSAEEKEAADNGQVSYYKEEEGYCPARLTSKEEREKRKKT